jgi:hypothetical protein
MAFNPFTWFRKHQKVFFAGLTVLCMLVFIGQAGVGADIFQTVLRWIGAERAFGPAVTTLYGKKVTESDLVKLETQRRAANDFVITHVLRAHQQALAGWQKDKLKNTSPDNPLAGLKEVVDAAQRNIQMYQQMMFQGRPLPREFLLPQIEENLQRLKDIARREKVKDDPENLQLLQNVATVLGYQAWLAEPQHQPYALSYLLGSAIDRRRMPPVFCFGGTSRTEDLLDFLVWKHEADRLGISLTDEDLIREINAEAGGQEVFGEKVRNLEREKAIVEHAAFYRNLTTRDLVNALRNEFRVAMAQGLLTGSEPGARAYRGMLGATSSPAVGTPDEFLQYYRDQRTTLRVKMLDVPVSAFLDKVKGSPTEKELRSRYERYREVEPNPASREPGFKEPRRVAVEYVSASSNDAHYRELARKQAAAWKKYADPVQRAAVSLSAGLPVPGGAPAFAQALMVLSRVALDPVGEGYEKYVQDQHPWISSPSEDLSTLRERAGKLHLTSVLRPAHLASLIGILHAPVPGGNVALPAAVGFRSLAAIQETQEAAKQAMTLLLARSDPGQLFSAAALTLANSPKVLSEKEMEPILLASLEEQIAADTLQRIFNDIRTELVKLKGKDRAAIKAYLDGVVKEHHLAYRAMPKALPRQTIIDDLKRKADLGLGTLQQEFLSREPGLKVEDFVGDLFRGQGTYEAVPLPGMQQGKPEFLYWRYEDHPARTRPYSVVRDEVEKAWRFEQARKLARQEAERLEAKINSDKMSPADAERFLREQKLGELFELDNVAQLVPPTREVHEFTRTEYRPYRVPEDMAEKLPSPPGDMVKQLLTLKRPGEATYITDLPAKNFYVAVLFNRDEPTVKQFVRLYEKSPTQDTLYPRFVATRREEHRRAVMEQLRREASGGKVDKEGRFDLPEAVRKREGGRGGEEEG